MSPDGNFTNNYHSHKFKILLSKIAIFRNHKRITKKITKEKRSNIKGVVEFFGHICIPSYRFSQIYIQITEVLKPNSTIFSITQYHEIFAFLFDHGLPSFLSQFS